MEKAKFISEPSLTGSISLRCEEEVLIDFSLNTDFVLPKTDVIKIYIFSSCKKIPPINAGTARRGGNAFFLSGTVDFPKDFSFSDADGAEIVQKNVFTEEQTTLARVYFECDEEKIKTPLENASEALENVKATLSNAHDGGAFQKQIDYLNCRIRKFQKADFPVSGFEWYRINDIYEDFMLTSIHHVLSSEHTLNCLLRRGFYLLGINGGYVAVAVMYAKGEEPPLERADDCRREYLSDGASSPCAVAGILIEPDGQYFTTVEV